MIQHHDWSTVAPRAPQQDWDLTDVKRYVLGHNQ